MSESWSELIQQEKLKSYFRELETFLKTERDRAPESIFPPEEWVFRAFDLTPFQDVRVCIIGQDPYPARGQAVGLSFAVSEATKIPASLNRIFIRVGKDGFAKPTGRTLEGWAKQGVLLLNRVLTVREGKPNSHSRRGWEQFTDAAVSLLNSHEQPIVFLLWGGGAQSVAPLVTASRHRVLRSSHPVAISGFDFYRQPMFAAANEFLSQMGRGTIDWSRS